MFTHDFNHYDIYPFIITFVIIIPVHGYPKELFIQLL
jgi:hypothetical protein